MLSIAADSIHRPAPILRRANAWLRPRTVGYALSALALLIALCTVLLGPARVTAATFSGERWALIIGISDYEDKDLRLRFADRDAEAFKDFLKSPRGGGFADDHVRFLSNRKATAGNIREALGTFLGRAKPQDYVVIFLAGHGLPDPRDADDFYFLPYNADLTRLPSTAVSMWEVERWVEKIEAQRVLLIADACHSGAMGSKGIARGPNEINRYLQRLGESFQTVMTLTSSSGHQLSQEDKKWGSGHGVFTYYLLRALQADAEHADRDNDGIVDAEEAYLYIVTQVIADTDGEQVPDRSGDLGSGIPLAVVSPGAAPASKTTPPVAKRSPARVQALLRECAAHLQAHRLTTGRGGNAVDCYTEVLKLDRGNTEALAGLDQVVAKYAEWSERAIARRQFNDAETYLERMERVNPEYPGLIDLRDQLAAAKTPAVTTRPSSALGPDMIRIKGDCFQMGSPTAEAGRQDDERQHRVCVDDFALGQHEVKVADFRQFVNATGYRTEAEQGEGCRVWTGEQFDLDATKHWQHPGFSQDDRHPVVCVSWNDAQAYVEWLSRKTGLKYRLPTEAEWEYAARAGTTTARFWGDDPDQACRYASVRDSQYWTDYVHNCRDGYHYTAPVGSFQPNDFGLYDMLGNVWEWTCSVYDEKYGGAEQRCAPVEDSGRRVVRGGSWGGNPGFVRSALRYWYTLVYRNDVQGFRLAQDL